MKRIITGIVLIALTGGVMVEGQDLLFAFLCLAGILGIYEALNMSNMLNKWQRLGMCGGYALALLGIYTNFSYVAQYIYLGGIAVCYGMILPELIKKKNIYKKHNIVSSIRYFLYLFFGFSSVMLVRSLEHGGLYVAIIFAAIWACDIFALYGGRKFGKTPLSELSPKKTVEGTLIGMLSASLVVGALCVAFNVDYSIILMGGVIAFLGQLGDLYESLLKRSFGVKDSSNLLPGHGGVLDRADSMLFVFPIAYVILWAFVV